MDRQEDYIVKKVVSFFLAVIMCSTLCVPAFAVSKFDENNSRLQVFNPLETTEASMPSVGVGNSRSNYSVSARESWAKSTGEILANAYDQKLDDISESSEYIIFSFEAPEEIEPNVGYIDRVEYLKPEADTWNSTYSKKITYMYGWLDGYYSIEEKTGTWSAIKDLTITVAGLINKISIQAFALSVLGIAADTFKGPEKVNAQTTSQYFVLNKIGQLKDPTTGIWGHYTYVGSRRAFYRTLLEKEVSNGYYNTLGVEETTANNTKNPTNYDKIEYKSHFSDNNWILNKTEDVYENGTRAYMDVFAMTDHFSSTWP